MNINLCCLSILLIVLFIYLYKPGWIGLERYVNFNPDVNVGEKVVWTYIEKPFTGSSVKTISGYNYIDDIPYFLKICTLLMEKSCRDGIKFIVLTPENICKYIKDFPIIMNGVSEYPLRYRVDLLGAHILEKYGGIWLSPGTIIQKKTFYVDIFHQLKDTQCITFGSNDSIINNCNLRYNPDNLVIASIKNNPIISIYKLILNRQQNNYQLPPDSIERINNIKELIDTNKYNFNPDSKIGTYALGEAFRIAKSQEIPFTHYNYNCMYDGRKDSSNRYITVKDLLSTTDIHFANKKKLLFVSVPYNELYELQEFKWFYNLSEYQFYESEVNIVKYVKNSVKNCNSCNDFIKPIVCFLKK